MLLLFFLGFRCVRVMRCRLYLLYLFLCCRWCGWWDFLLGEYSRFVLALDSVLLVENWYFGVRIFSSRCFFWVLSLSRGGNRVLFCFMNVWKLFLSFGGGLLNSYVGR